MPEYWYSIKANNANEKKVTHDVHSLNARIIASRKPYFMEYVYSTLKTDVAKWKKDCDIDCAKKFRVKGTDELKIDSEEKRLFVEYMNKKVKVGSNPCTVNRICWIFEDAFPDSSVANADKEFDYSILKSGIDYSEKDYRTIERIYEVYKSELDAFHQQVRTYGYDANDDLKYDVDTFKEKFRSECAKVCPNEQELCDIILDLCYTKEYSKQFVWDIVGSTIVDNLLSRNKKISFPQRNGTEFEFGGETFDMVSLDYVKGEEE